MSEPADASSLYDLDEVMAEVVEVLSRTPPGVESLCRMADAFLDAHLQRPLLSASLRLRQRAQWRALCNAELEAMSLPHSALPARIAAALVQEVLAAETIKGAALPESRHKVHRYMRLLGVPPSEAQARPA